MFIAKLSEQRQKFRRRNIDAAARLNRFDEDCANFIVAKDFLERQFERLQIIFCGGKFCEVSELPELRAERRAKMFAVRGVERAIAEAVIAAFERDDAALAGGEHGRLQRGFDGLKTGIGKDDLAGFEFGFVCPAFKCEPAQFARELGFQCVRMHVAHRVQEFCHLLLTRFDDLGIRMAGRGNAKGGGQI